MSTYQFTRRNFHGLTLLDLEWDRPASTLGLCADGTGRVYLSLNITDPVRRLPEYRIVELELNGASPRDWQVPKPVYLPGLFRREDGAVWVLGAVETGNREAEVLMPVHSQEVPPGRRRFPASEETILSTRGEALVRFLRDTWKKAPARVVTDTLGEKGKRTEWKLPKEPYPSGAWMDSSGLIHVLSWAQPESLHSIYKAGGELVAERPVAFHGVGGRGGYRPIEMASEGPYRFVTGHGAAIGVVTTCPGGEPVFGDFLTLPDDHYVFALWPAVPFGETGWVTRFTFGSETAGGAGNGWLAVRDGRLIASWLAAGPGVYRDHRGFEHRLDEAQLSLSGLDVLPDGRFACCFETQARNQPGRVHVALVTP